MNRQIPICRTEQTNPDRQKSVGVIFCFLRIKFVYPQGRPMVAPAKQNQTSL
jgi:hypothetical protein